MARGSPIARAALDAATCRSLLVLAVVAVLPVFGEYDLMIIAEMPNAESMAAVALAVAAGGAVRSATTTVLVSGAEGVAAMQKAATVANSYKPAR